MIKKYLLIALFQASFHAYADESTQWNKWIPHGWKIIKSAQGDLNGDKEIDAALVIEQTNDNNKKADAHIGTRLLNLNPRRLLVLIKAKGGYKIPIDSQTFFPPEDDEENSCVVDPLADGDIEIKNATLVVDLRHWMSCGGWDSSDDTYRFRMENERLRLIGFDNSTFSRSSGEGTELSMNFLTGKQNSTTGLNMFEDQPREDKPVKVEWSNIPGSRKLYIEDMDPRCRMETNLDPSCKIQ